MTGYRPRNRISGRCAAARINAAEIAHVFVRPWRSNVAGREVVLGRALAQISEEETADRGDKQAPTERGQDKRPQCAARLGCCFCLAFLPFLQCAPDWRNVRADIKSLLKRRFPHLVGAGDGAWR
jgi:hypothetical protein